MAPFGVPPIIESRPCPPASTSLRSCSAAATSAASDRRPRSSGRARRRSRRSRSWTRPGRSASTGSTPRTPTAAAAARRGSASGSRPPATGRGSRRRRSTRWTRATTPASRPARVRRQLDSSLERLGVDRDRPLPRPRARSGDADPRRRSARSRSSSRRALVAAYGVSNYGARRAARGARRRTRPRCVQNSFSLLDRGDEDGRDPALRRARLAYQVFGPLAGGWLTGKYRRGAALPEGSRMTMRPEPYTRFDSEPVYRLARRARGARGRARREHGRPRARLAARASGRDLDRRRPAHAGASRAGPRGARARAQPGRARAK